MKPLTFLGTSLNDLRGFSEAAQDRVGYQLHRVQCGEEPTNWKPMTSIGAGVREIRERDESGAYRVIYIATFKDTVYVLHAFRKETQKTARKDIDKAKARLKELKAMMK